LGYERRQAIALKRNLPAFIKVLFIAEAPPSIQSHRFFYFLDVSAFDTLFLEMMKVLYPKETGFSESHSSFLPGYSASRVRSHKAEFLQRFQMDGFYLIDASARPMPAHATSEIKTRYLQEEFPGLLRRLRSLRVDQAMPIILIGALTFGVCAPRLRKEGFHILHYVAINHPARGGQRLFRRGLKAALQLKAGIPIVQQGG
jgi:hypothetical protein